MSIRIDPDRCIGCGCCREICPGGLIGLEGGRAHMRYPDDCWACASCLKACPTEAVALYLGADIGGAGGEMTVSGRGDLLVWTVTRPDGSRERLEIDRTQSNNY